MVGHHGVSLDPASIVARASRLLYCLLASEEDKPKQWELKYYGGKSNDERLPNLCPPRHQAVR